MLKDFTALIGLLGIVAAAAAKIWFAVCRADTPAHEQARPTKPPARTRTRGHWHQAARAAVPRRKLANSRV